MLSVASSYLHANKETVNALNVFPVPDGDTGSNMCLTMDAAVEQMLEDEDQLGRAANALSYGSLMGARGNSGVILSQILRGLALGFEGQLEADAPALADALKQGVRTAYRAVMKPVEGTMLTVIREAAVAARRAADGGADVDEVLDSACAAAHSALARTPDQLEVLKRAGVVDAGGQGLVHILDGLLAGWRGELPAMQQERVQPTTVAFELSQELGDIDLPYDTELLIRSQQLDHDTLQEQLGGLGDSIVLVDGGPITKVHIHTADPAAVLSLCLQFGDIDDVVIKNMIQQHRQLESATGAGYPQTPDYYPTAMSERPANQVGLIAVVSGDGFTRLFEEMGVDVVVAGGQTMNPSTQEILKAVESLDPDTVIVLPNNSNVTLTCQQVAELTDKAVHVVETKDMAQGLAALLPWKADSTAPELVPAMEAAIGDVRTGAVTYAVRETRVGDIEVSEGSVLGLTNGQIALAGEDPQSVLLQLVGSMVDEETEIVSVFAGSMIEGGVVDQVCATLADQFEDLDVEVLSGGQDHYYFLVSVE